MTAYKFIETSVDQQVGMIELNRPKQLNSLNRNMVSEILEALQSFDRNDEIRVILLVGKGKAFSAGADIDEMAGADSMSLELLNQFADWDQIPLIKKPVIGAVHGFVFGGGFELALCCDVLLAADGTEFSFPEVTLGVMPGAGGTQRLTKLVGRAKAIEWLWTGERIKATELQKHGVINRIVSQELLREEALRFSNKVASMPPLAIRMIKDSVNKAVDYPLYEGMQYERKNFYLLFSSEDQKEGMQAFVEKRKPIYKGK
ncbi:enoyl-CoA hydratase [Sporosarcina sp. P3]|uniref:enoyl-CoA hydratase/isomerase family protein n=1 Tax=Sporosarcina TaxID=1569 RepID=UPI0009DC4E70|nr:MULTISPECIES: enoyl-CoA hydratase-related protein [Sporosarcina]ARF17647.1 enoyl-CoA hydratase [Sporosarcina ureae]PID21284.1 enoyl-CoA hydratase [Sporosarcina sp. P3]